MRVLAANSNGIETHIFCLTLYSQVLFVVSGQVWPGVITGSPQQTVVTKPVRTKGATVTGTQIVADCSAVFVQVITSPQIGPQILNPPTAVLPPKRQTGTGPIAKGVVSSKQISMTPPTLSNPKLNFNPGQPVGGSVFGGINKTTKSSKL